MKKEPEVFIKELLRYKVDYPYFGRVSSRVLSDAWGTLKKSVSWDNPVNFVSIEIGDLNAKKVYDVLMKEMSYNPLRWGNAPLDKSILHFCDARTASLEELTEVKWNLSEFLHFTARPNGQWHDGRISPDGRLAIAKKPDGHSNKDYKLMRALFNSVKVIANQNVKDFSEKRGIYRNEIINTVSAIYPADISISDFGLTYDCPPEHQLDLLKKYKLITLKEYHQKYR